MKEFRIMVMAAAVALLAAGCRDYALKEDLEALNERVAALEQICGSLNEDVASLSIIVDALQKNIYVTSVAETQQKFLSCRLINFFDAIADQFLFNFMQQRI